MNEKYWIRQAIDKEICDGCMGRFDAGEYIFCLNEKMYCMLCASEIEISQNSACKGCMFDIPNAVACLSCYKQCNYKKEKKENCDTCDYKTNNPCYRDRIWKNGNCSAWKGKKEISRTSCNECLYEPYSCSSTGRLNGHCIVFVKKTKEERCAGCNSLYMPHEHLYINNGKKYCCKECHEKTKISRTNCIHIDNNIKYCKHCRGTIDIKMCNKCMVYHKPEKKEENLSTPCIECNPQKHKGTNHCIECPEDEETE